MKTLQLLTTIALLLIANSVWAQREVYDRYVGRDDIDIVYVHDYRIDSVNTMDVILIRAKDSAGWEWMKEEFNILPLSNKNRDVINRGKDVLKVFFTNKADPTKPMDTDLMKDCLITISYQRKELCISYYNTFEQARFILHKNNERIINSN